MEFFRGKDPIQGAAQIPTHDQYFASESLSIENL
jgi:hypothetical protein